MDERHVGQVRAKLSRFRDRAAVIGSDDGGPRFAADLAVAASAAARVQHAQALQVFEFHAGLGLKRRAVFFVVSDLVLVPLPPEAGQVCVAREPPDPLDDEV